MAQFAKIRAVGRDGETGRKQRAEGEQAKRAKGIKQVGERCGMGEMALHNLIKANPGKVAAQVDRGPNLPVPGASPRYEGRGGLKGLIKGRALTGQTIAPVCPSSWHRVRQSLVFWACC